MKTSWSLGGAAVWSVLFFLLDGGHRPWWFALLLATGVAFAARAGSELSSRRRRRS